MCPRPATSTRPSANTYLREPASVPSFAAATCNRIEDPRAGVTWKLAARGLGRANTQVKQMRSGALVCGPVPEVREERSEHTEEPRGHLRVHKPGALDEGAHTHTLGLRVQRELQGDNTHTHIWHTHRYTYTGHIRTHIHTRKEPQLRCKQ